jgi:hypothetical protein
MSYQLQVREQPHHKIPYQGLPESAHLVLEDFFLKKDLWEAVGGLHLTRRDVPHVTVLQYLTENDYR